MPRLRHSTRLTLLLLGVAVLPESLLGQDVRWPSPGTRLRITSLPGPPPTVDQSLTRLGLASAPTRLVRRANDGHVRFSASLVRAGNPFAVAHATTTATADFRLAELASVEVFGGRVGNPRTGFKVGLLAGAAWGVLLLRAISDNPPAGDYVLVPLIFAIPGGGIGALIGAVIRSDVWDPIYTNSASQH